MKRIIEPIIQITISKETKSQIEQLDLKATIEIAIEL